MFTILAIMVGLIIEAFTAMTAETAARGSVLAGDVGVYEERWRSIADGSVPYVDGLFEHLPLMLVPIAVAGLVSDIVSLDYQPVFVTLMALVVVATAWVVCRIGDDLDVPGAFARWLLVTTPLLPLVLFRLDAVPVLFAAAAVMLALRERDLLATGSAALCVLAKGWPAMLAVTDWWRGRRRHAVLLAVFAGVVLGSLLLTPGFRAGRSFAGVHQESLSGSVVLVWRHLADEPLGIIGQAGAVYLDVGRWSVLVNLLVGGMLALIGLRAVRSVFTWRRGIVLLCALTLATVLASPLLSAQFLFWPTAFLAVVARRRSLVLFTAAAVATTLLFGYWAPAEAWWATLLLVRNLLVLGLAVLAALAAWSAREQLP